MNWKCVFFICLLSKCCILTIYIEMETGACLRFFTFFRDSQYRTKNVALSMASQTVAARKLYIHFITFSTFYFQSCDTSRKLQSPGATWNQRRLYLQRWKTQRSEVSGLGCALLNSCEEVVWQTGTHRRSGIRHLFIMRSLLLLRREILAVPGRLWFLHLTLFHKHVFPKNEIIVSSM